ncbi:MAG TPA: TPM domain-containing protein [Planctomycetota bacterium]|nr:TPM domain-containing protein [Planctomycetota bacterium]
MLRLALLALIVLTAAAEDLRDPRPGSWVLDRTGRIPVDDARRIDAIADAAQRRGAGQIVAVVVATTGGAEHRRYATELFNRWQVGTRGRDDGVLVFVALDDRRAEIVLGDGVDDDRQVAASQRIYDQAMRPRLREGAPGTALVDGVRACAMDILGLPADALPDAIARTASEAPRPAHAPAAPSTTHDYPGPEAEHPRAPRLAAPAAPAGGFPHRIGTPGSDPSPFLILLGVLGCIGAFLVLRLWLRHRTRACPGCRQPMHRLDEQADDRWLSEGEQVEERVGSVNYDVWLCDGCGASEKLRYGRWFTSYSGCPRCQAKTLSRSTRTLRAATEWSGGLEQVDERCAHCPHTHRWERSTPRVVRHRSSGFSGGSSFGSRSSFGGGSRSSGFGGGGGRSSGRGGGGSW